VNSLFSGKGNRCALKDDFEWLLDKMLDADGIVITTPIFEKGTCGTFHDIVDRFGPRMDRGNNTMATEIAGKMNGIKPDPRILKDKVISFMGIGGSDWMTQVQTDMAMLALTPMWKVIDNDVFSWSLGILSDRCKVHRAHKIGENLAEAAKDIANAQYCGEAGICPHCHSRQFFIRDDGKVVCCLCGVVGELKRDGEKYTFDFPSEQLEHAHDSLSGKLMHGNDINTNNSRMNATVKTEQYKNWVKEYKDFIVPLKPAREM
jgi:multimeric flavodoxin WrbA